MSISVADFAAEAEVWLKEHGTPLPADREDKMPQPGDELALAVFHNLSHDEEQAVLDELAAWHQKKAERGYHAISWPTEFGGLGLTKAHQRAFNRLEGQYLIPERHELFSVTVGLIAPTVNHFGTDEQKDMFVKKLLTTEWMCAQLFSEPGAGSDLAGLGCRAERDGDEWVINGHKWFSSNASVSDVLIVMCKTNLDEEASPYSAFSMIVVPTRTPGVNIVRDVPTMGEPDHKTGEPGGHAEIIYDNVRVPVENMVGGDDGVGQGFALAQKRLGPGRIHHAMRWLGQSQRAFDLLCERALTRYTKGSILAEKQMIQDWVAQSYADRQAARLLTLQAAWKMDQLHAAGRHYSDARLEIGVIKFWGAKVLHDVIDRAIQIHGSLGYTTDLPLEAMYRAARAARIYDGPDEVHKVTVARQVLKGYRPSDPSIDHIPSRREAALTRYADYLDELAVNA